MNTPTTAIERIEYRMLLRKFISNLVLILWGLFLGFVVLIEFLAWLPL